MHRTYGVSVSSHRSLSPHVGSLLSASNNHGFLSRVTALASIPRPVSRSRLVPDSQTPQILSTALRSDSRHRFPRFRRDNRESGEGEGPLALPCQRPAWVVSLTSTIWRISGSTFNRR